MGIISELYGISAFAYQIINNQFWLHLDLIVNLSPVAMTQGVRSATENHFRNWNVVFFSSFRLFNHKTSFGAFFVFERTKRSKRPHPHKSTKVTVRLISIEKTDLFRTTSKFHCDVSSRVSDTNNYNSLVFVPGKILVIVRVNLFSLIREILFKPGLDTSTMFLLLQDSRNMANCFVSKTRNSISSVLWNVI